MKNSRLVVIDNDSYTSSVLTLLKDQLANSQLLQCEASRVSFAKGAVVGTIWADGGNVHCQCAGKDCTLPLGDLGRLTFVLQRPHLSVQVLASESTGAEHCAQISLPVADH